VRRCSCVAATAIDERDNRLKPAFLALIAVVLDVIATALFPSSAVAECAVMRFHAVISRAVCRRDFGAFVWSGRAGEYI
jgi:hypothetical protein